MGKTTVTFRSFKVIIFNPIVFDCKYFIVFELISEKSVQTLDVVLYQISNSKCIKKVRQRLLFSKALEL